nr:hypothetical protein [Hymenobacter nivis]
MLHTRTGRNFFTDGALETAFLARLRDALATAGFWEKFDTDWVCLDAELLPWSAKAQELVKTQYAAVAATATAALPQAEAVLAAAAARGLAGAGALLARTTARREAAAHYADAYRRYCRPVHSLDDLKLAPFTCSPPRATRTSTATTLGTWKPCAPSPWPIRACCAPRPTKW